MDLNEVDPTFIQMHWDIESGKLIESFGSNANNAYFLESPLSAISMDSGFSNDANINVPSPSVYGSAQPSFSPGYYEYNTLHQTASAQQHWPVYIQHGVSEPMFLEIREQPNDTFRFRYPTEMQGPHGTIKGNNCNGGKSSKSYPTVILHNCNATSEVVIKCSLYQKDEEGSDQRFLHPHRLAMRPNHIEKLDPYYVKVSEANNFTAVFAGLGVIQTKRERMADVLANKMKKEREYEGNTCISSSQIEAFHAEAKIIAKKKVEINQVALGFTAYGKDIQRNEWKKITETVYSTIINNEKGVSGKLSIARMSVCKGEAQGGTEIFMFVNKVDKNTIQVRFFETHDKTPNGSIMWESNGIFTPSDVHHQYGIVLKTPAYRDPQIKEEVTVFVQLYRKTSPTKGSETVKFTYKPNSLKRKIKQARTSTPPIPTTVDSYSLENNLPSTSSFPGADCGDQMNFCTFGGSSLREEHEDSEIINLIIRFAEGYDSPPSDISSIMRDLSGGLEIDSAVPKEQKSISSLDTLNMNERVIEVLIKSTNDDSYAFADLVERGKIEDIQALTLLIVKYKLTKVLQSRNDVDQNVLHLSILNGYYNIFKVFLKLGVNVNQTDAYGQTPLHLAVIANSFDCLNALLSTKDLSLNIANDKGETALSLSVFNNQLSFTKLLVKAGADPSIIDQTNGFNCLHIAANSISPSLEMIRFLTEFDESMLHIESNSGKTPLQLSITNGLTRDIINYLSTTFQDCDEVDELELDEICLKKLCDIFDKGNWKVWATLMDMEEKIGEWEGLESPSRALFTYLKTSKKSLDDLISLFDLLSDAERTSAMNTIDEMVARKFDQ